MLNSKMNYKQFIFGYRALSKTVFSQMLNHTLIHYIYSKGCVSSFLLSNCVALR